MIRKLFIISLIWAVIILIACAVPGGSLPATPFLSIPNFDKIVHAGLYLPLAVVLGAEFDLSGKRLLQLFGPLLTILIIAFYGGLIEILQEYLFVGRSADIADFLFDVIGGLAGLTLYYLFVRPFLHKLIARRRG